MIEIIIEWDLQKLKKIDEYFKIVTFYKLIYLYIN